MADTKIHRIFIVILLSTGTCGYTQTPVHESKKTASGFFGQASSFSGPIATDRPTFSLGASTVPKGRVQFETGYTFVFDDKKPDFTSHTFPETLVRFGLTDRLEMRIEWPTQVFIHEGVKTSGLNDLAVGFKTQITQQDKWTPQFSLAGRLFIPTGDKDLSSDQVNPELQAILSYALNDTIALFGNANIGGASIEKNRFAQFSASFGMSASLNRSLSGFAEYFGFYPIDASVKYVHLIHTGVVYQLTGNLQLDARIGTGLNHGSADLVTGAGLSWRF